MEIAPCFRISIVHATMSHSSFDPAASSDDLEFGPTTRGFIDGQKVFARYTLKTILGRGGMGVVWRAWDEQLERDIALKFMPEMVRLDPQAVDELKRETRKSLELTHPSIVRIHDFVQDQQSAAIAMEYVDGPTLSALRIQKPNRLFEVEEIRPWIEEVCAALQYAHERTRVVHRDLKPANLMLNGLGQLKIADFGIARSLSDSASRLSVATHDTSGTMAYMSPQQALGEKPSAADDIYSLGATIYDLLTGKPPFFSGNIYAQVRDKIPLSMATRREENEVPDCQSIPEAWEETVARCLAKDPAERPASIAEVWERLNRALVGRVVPNAPSPPIPARWGQRALPLIAAALLLAALGGAGWWFGYESPRRTQAASLQAETESHQKSEAQAAAAAKAKAETDARQKADAQKEADRLAAEKARADATATEQARLATTRQQLVTETLDLTQKAIEAKRLENAQIFADKLASLDPQNAQLTALRASIATGIAAQTEAQTAADAKRQAAEARASLVPTDLPASGFFSLSELFAGSRYAGYNSSSQTAILRRAQEELKSAGFYSGTLDGDSGPGTQGAVLDFQRGKTALQVTGRLDDPTLAALDLSGISEMAAPTPRPRPAATSRPKAPSSPSSSSGSGFFKEGNW